jgi:maltose-binding protein MalE
MVPDGCWMLSNYKTVKFKLGMALLPRGTTGQRIDPIWAANAGIPFFIAKGSENRDLAWAWLRWMAADKRANQMQARSGQNCGPPIVKQFDKLYAKGWNSIPGGNACLHSLDRTQYFQISALNWQKITDTIITPAWDKFVHNKITARQMARTIEPQINDALKSGG